MWTSRDVLCLSLQAVPLSYLSPLHEQKEVSEKINLWCELGVRGVRLSLPVFALTQWNKLGKRGCS